MTTSKYTPPPEAAESALIIREWYNSLDDVDRIILDAMADEMVENVKSRNPNARFSMTSAVEVIIKTFLHIGG